MQNIHETQANDYGGRDSDRHYEDEELDAMMLADQAEQADRAEARDADERAALAAAVPCESPAPETTEARLAMGACAVVDAVTALFERKAG